MILLLAFSAWGATWEAATSAHFLVLAYEGLDPGYIAGLAEGILERLLDLWGSPPPGRGVFDLYSRVSLVVYPDPDAFGSDTGLYGFTRLPLPLFGTPRIPSFERVLRDLEAESLLGMLVAGSAHGGLAKLRLAEAIAWTFIVTNMKELPSADESPETLWLNISGLARLSGTYVMGITEIPHGLSALWARECGGEPDLSEPPLWISVDLWASATAYMFQRAGGSIAEGARNFFKCLTGFPEPNGCTKYVTYGKNRRALGNYVFPGLRYLPRSECFMKPVAGPFGCGLSSFTPSSPRHPGMRSKPFTEVLR